MGTVKICQDYFNFELSISIVEKRRKVFVAGTLTNIFNFIRTFIRQSRQHNIAGKKTDRERQTDRQTFRQTNMQAIELVTDDSMYDIQRYHICIY